MSDPAQARAPGLAPPPAPVPSPLDPEAFLAALSEGITHSAAERWAAALPAWERVVAANPVDGDFWAALGRARERTGDQAGAIAAYAEALSLGSGMRTTALPVLARFETLTALARCEAARGDHRAALTYLDQALAAGLRDLDAVRDEPAFAPLRSLPAFRALLGESTATPGDRTAGWRGDIAFLAREIKRRAPAPFRLITERDFDTAVAALSDQVPALSDGKILIACRRLLAHLDDAHAYLWPDPNDERWHHALPVRFFQFVEGTFVVAAAPEHADLLGRELIAVDEHPLAAVIAAVESTVARDNHNPQWPRHQLAWRLRETPFLHALGVAADPTAATLSLRPPGGVVGRVTLPAALTPVADRRNRAPRPADWVFLPATLPQPLPLTCRRMDAPYWFTSLAAQQAVYFQFNAVRDAPAESFATFCDRLFAFIADQPVAKLIIDMRRNGGGNTFLELQFIRHLIRAKINQHGRLFVIIGRGTFSAAQNGAGMMARYTAAVFVGEPTGSSPTFIGETIPFTLPYSRAEVNVSDLLWQTMWPMDDRRWLPPLLYTPPTFADFARNHDAAMAAILAWETHGPGQ